jgi:hypothetical protein
VTDADHPAEGQAPLSVDADLSAEIDGATVAVRGVGDRVFVDAPSVNAGLRALGGAPTTRQRALDSLLRTADLTVEFRVRETPVAVVGAGARPGPLSRSLDLDPVELRVGGVASAAGRELLAGLRVLGRVVR